MASQPIQSNKIKLQWFQNKNTIIFNKYNNSCGTGLYNATKKKLMKAGMNFTAWHQQPLKAVLYHCIYSSHTNRPVDCPVKGRRALRSVIDEMEKLGWLEFKGGKSHVAKNISYNSKFRPTAHFEKILNRRPLPLRGIKDVRIINIKDADGNTVGRKALSSSTADGRAIQDYNDFISQQKIECTFKGGDFKKEDSLYGMIGTYVLNSQIARIYTDKEHDGGRLYNQDVLRVQSLSGKLRKRITINGNATTELDFDELHPTMIYNKEGLSAPKVCYAIYPNDPTGQLRKCVKMAFNTTINASNIRKAYKSVMQTVCQKKPSLLKELERHYGTQANPKRCVKNVLRDTITHHRPIIKWFCSSAWKTLQNEDATMMLIILRTLQLKDIPALPIHDSIVIEDIGQNVVTAKGIMKQIYFKRYGYNIGVS